MNTQQAQKRPNKHRSNNTMVGTTEGYGSKIMEGAKNGLKRGKLTIKQGLALERSKTIKNGKSENNSCHKRSSISGKMHR